MRRRVYTASAVAAQTTSFAVTRLLTGGGLGFLLLLSVMLGSASPARAVCAPAAVDATDPAPGTTVTCTGTTTDQNGTNGYGTGNQTGITVNVEALASVTGSSSSGIYIGDGTVANLGAISGRDGIYANNGSISATNSGSIFGVFDGIFANTNATVTNNAGGTIDGGTYGIRASAGFADVTNSGSITSLGANGIFANTNAIVTNEVGGTITGGQSGIHATTGFANVTNSGGITGTSGFGIYAGANAVVTNNVGGSISGGQFGIFADLSSATVSNSGSISGANFYGIFARTNATVTNNAGGTISGKTYGLRADGFATVTNSGSITGTDTAGIYAETNASVNNNAGGIISGSQYGIYANTGFANVTNSGSFTGTTGYGIYAGTNAIVTNNAGGSITGDIGIRPVGGNSIVFNAGTITGTGGTAILFGGSSNILTLAPGFAVNGNVLGAGSDTLQLGGTGSSTFDVSSIGAQYQGFGAFNKVDTSIFALTGSSTFAGPVNVNGGRLDVNGDTTSFASLTVNAGGTLGGIGTVGNTTVNGGILAPGNPTSTLTVQGSLVMTAAATYMVEVSSANAARTDVIGTATLNGVVKAVFAPGAYVAKQYTILNATGGRSGMFGSLINTNLPPGFLSALSYDANNVYLDLNVGFTQYNGLNVNQQNVANALTNFFNTTGGIPAVFGALTPAGLTQVSGEAATGTQQATFQAMDQFMGVLLDPFLGNRSNGMPQGGRALGFAQDAEPLSASNAYAAITGKAPRRIADPFTSRWSVWAAGYGGMQTTDGNAAVGSNTTTSRIGGIAVGADYRLSPDTLVGFAFGGGGTNYAIANGLGRGSSDLFQAGAFVRHTAGAAYLTGAVAYGWQDVTVDRTVTVAGTDLMRARFDANALSGRVETGYRFATLWMGITPYAAGQFTTFYLPDYTERVIAGANTFALAYASKDASASRSELGLRADKSYPLETALLILRGRAAWAHNFDTDRSIGATFQTLPGASFVVNGAAQARDAALVSVAAELKWLNGISLASTFDGEFSDVTRSFAGKGIVRYVW